MPIDRLTFRYAIITLRYVEDILPSSSKFVHDLCSEIFTTLALILLSANNAFLQLTIICNMQIQLYQNSNSQLSFHDEIK